MDPLKREAARQRGERKLEAMRRRTSQLRRRIVAIATVSFVALWAVVFVQMATGNDPVLGAGGTSRHAAVTGSARPDPEQRPSAAAAPPSEEEEESAAAAAAEEAAAAETETTEEAAEVEQIELESREAEALELEELEAVTTGQS